MNNCAACGKVISYQRAHFEKVYSLEEEVINSISEFNEEDKIRRTVKKPHNVAICIECYLQLVKRKSYVKKLTLLLNILTVILPYFLIMGISCVFFKEYVERTNIFIFPILAGIGMPLVGIGYIALLGIMFTGQSKKLATSICEKYCDPHFDYESAVKNHSRFEDFPEYQSEKNFFEE